MSAAAPPPVVKEVPPRSISAGAARSGSISSVTTARSTIMEDPSPSLLVPPSTPPPSTTSGGSHLQHFTTSTSTATSPGHGRTGSSSARSLVGRRPSQRTASNLSTTSVGSMATAATAGSTTTNATAATGNGGGDTLLAPIASSPVGTTDRKGSLSTGIGGGIGGLGTVNGPFQDLIAPTAPVTLRSSKEQLDSGSSSKIRLASFLADIPDTPPALPSVDYLSAIPLGPLVRDQLVAADRLSLWDPAAEAIIASLAAPRVAIVAKSAHLSDYQPLIEAAAASSSTAASEGGRRASRIIPSPSSTSVLQLCQDAVWTPRPIPPHRRILSSTATTMTDSIIPLNNGGSAGGWIELALTECVIPEYTRPIFLQLSLHDEATGNRLSATVHMEKNIPANAAILAAYRGTATPATQPPVAMFPADLALRPGVVLVVRVDHILENPDLDDKKAQASPTIGAAVAKLAMFRMSWAAAVVNLAEVAPQQVPAGASAAVDLHLRSVLVRKPHHGQSLAAFVASVVRGGADDILSATSPGSTGSVANGSPASIISVSSASSSSPSSSPLAKAVPASIRFSVRRQSLTPAGLTPAAALARPAVPGYVPPSPRRDTAPSLPRGGAAAAGSSYDYAADLSDHRGVVPVVDGRGELGAASQVTHELFLRPMQLIQRKGKGRNIVCSVEICNSKGESIACITGRACESEWRKKAWTNIVYHEKNPIMDDEIKCRLAPTAEPLHARFTFHHVSCKEKHPGELTPNGYTVLPLTDARGRFLHDGEYTLAVSQGEVPTTGPAAAYLTGESMVVGSNTNGSGSISANATSTGDMSTKDTFTLQLLAFSSFVVQDEALHTFLSAAVDSSDPSVLVRASPSSLVRFHVAVLDHLFAKFSLSMMSLGARAAVVRAVIHVLRTLHEESLASPVSVLRGSATSSSSSATSNAAAGSLLTEYISNRLDAAGVHIAVATGWISILEGPASSAAPPPTVAAWAEFGLEVAWAIFNTLVKSMALARIRDNGSTSADEIDCVKRLVGVISPLVHKKTTNGLTLAKELNIALAYFLRDLIPLVPFTVIESLMALHNDPITLSDSATLATLKFDFLSIMCGSEHPIPLDYPVDESLRFLHHSAPEVRLVAASLLRDVLSVRELVMHGVPTKVLLEIAASLAALLPDIARPCGTTEVLLLRTVAICALYTLDKVVHEPRLGPWVVKAMQPREWAQRVLISFNAFQYTSSAAVAERLAIVQHRNNVGGTKKLLEEYFKANSGAFGRMKGARNSAGPLMLTQMPVPDTASQVSKVDDRSISAEISLSHATGVLMLSIWDALDAQFGEPAHSAQLETLVQATWTPSSDPVMVQVLLRLAKVAERSPVLILDDYLHPFVDALLQKASSAVESIRSAAGSALLAMFRACHRLELRMLEMPLLGASEPHQRLRRSFATFRIHVTVSIAMFNGNGLNHIAECFEEISKTCESGSDVVFRNTMRAASVLLSEVIRNQVSLKNISDLESKIDCYQEIKERYHNTPDLRLCTIETMANLLTESGSHAEAAMAHLHAAALISEHLVTQSPTYPGPKGAKAFAACNFNIAQETLDESVLAGGDKVFTSPQFSEDGLLQYLHRACEQLSKAQLFETINEVYKLCIPILEARHDWEGLAEAHQALSVTFTTLFTKHNRMLATYYRVGFFGTRWGDANGVEYVYRCKSVCVLPEFVTNLKASFASLGDRFEVLQDSGTIDESKLDPTKAYAQVTHVDPYFGDVKRYPNAAPPTSPFDQHHLLSTFVYMVPFTQSGRTHGDVASQYLRQVILTTARPFPYLAKRLKVARRGETVLNPLQVSTQALAARCTRLRALLHAVPVDAKSLQMVLSGSLRPQVNSGPAEIARVFLSPPVAPGQSAPVCAYSQSELEELRAAFRLFLRLSATGVEINRTLISKDQEEYQKDLEQGLTDMQNQLQPLLSSTVARPKMAPEGGESAPIKSVMEFLGSQGDLLSFLTD
ncbi:hypothetical protein BC828DRAFT_381069 [Blastocladiella britannica]|nr:hypothetical protein BC828DRAFT_381069 [Blastocladiella britannica]